MEFKEMEFKDRALRDQRELIRRGIKKFGSMCALGKELGIHKQSVHRSYHNDNEMKYSTLLKLKGLLNG